MEKIKCEKHAAYRLEYKGYSDSKCKKGLHDGKHHKVTVKPSHECKKHGSHYSHFKCEKHEKHKDDKKKGEGMAVSAANTHVKASGVVVPVVSVFAATILFG